MNPLRRDLDALDRLFDVLIVGGGVYGACIARIAARSGWSVALVERDDFGAGVSHNSLKIVHGGFRYLQHFDVPRIRESVAAQRAWLGAAPHLVRPLRCVIPTYGYGTRGPLALAAGGSAFRLLAAGRNTGLPARSHVGAPGVLSRRALLAAYPDLERSDVTGGAYWYDAQMLDANRLTFECIQDACDHGAAAANHVDAVELRMGADGVEGIVARDRLSGRELDVRARITINATGPGVEGLLNVRGSALRLGRPLVWTRNVNVVTRRVFAADDAVGVGSQRVSDAAIGRSKRLFFVTPWQDRSIIGTSHVRHSGSPSELAAAVQADVDAFLAEVDDALPRLRLGAGDICYVHSGLTPAEDELERSKRSAIVEHAASDGVRGLVSVLGIKYTTAPAVAARVAAAIARALGAPPADDGGFSSRLPGSPAADPESDAAPRATSPSDDRGWVARIYGSRAPALFECVPQDALPPAEHAFRCRVVYGIENEMVVRLRDAIFRATDLAERGELTAERLAWCAATLAAKLGWDAARRDSEVLDVRERLRRASPVQAAALDGAFA